MKEKELYFYGKLYANCYLGPDRSKYASKYSWFSYGRFGKKNMYYKFLAKNRRNVVLSPYVGEIPYFDRAPKIQDKKTVDKLNAEGLHIYVWEPFTIYGITEDFEYNNNERCRADTLYGVEKYMAWIPMSLYGDAIDRKFTVSGGEGEMKFRSFELDSIEKFAKTNGLTNITVHGIDANTENTLATMYPNIKIVRETIGKNYRIPQHLEEEPEDYQITKKFWCGNWRYSAHRHIIASYLVSKFSLDELNISWIRPSDEGLLKNMIYYTQDRLGEYWNPIVDGTKILKDIAPIAMDLPVDKIHGIHERVELGVWDVNPMPYYQECFCSIVTETKFAQPFASISEKSVYAILNQRPFIVVTAPYHLELLKTYGFKTFSNWWDESYDQEEDPYKRMQMILKLIDEIGSMSVEEMNKMYQDMKPLLIKNKKILLEYNELHEKGMRL